MPRRHFVKFAEKAAEHAQQIFQGEPEDAAFRDLTANGSALEYRPATGSERPFVEIFGKRAFGRAGVGHYP